MRPFLLPVICLTALLVSICGCGDSSGQCYTETDVLLYADFLNDSTHKAQSVAYVSVIGVGSDSMLYDSARVSRIALPLMPNNETTAYDLSFDIDSARRYTARLTFQHSNSPLVLSMECGGIVTHQLRSMSCSSDFITDWAIVNDQVINKESTHVHLFVP